MSSASEPSGLCPLDCCICYNEMINPIRLPCQHCFCRECVKDKKCPICGKSADISLLKDDSVLAYLIESSREQTEVCANCDLVIQPMYFCVTCQQPLCVNCKTSTHQAKIFSTHQIIDLEECGRARGRTICGEHNEPYILFCSDQRILMCVECFNNSSIDKRHNFVNIEAAHKICRQKLEKNANMLKLFQEELKEHVEVRKRVLQELDGNYSAAAADIEKKSNELISKIVEIKSNLLEKVENERKDRETELKQQLQILDNLMPPIKLNLLSASVFCSTASKIDLLHCYGDMIKSIQNITSHTMEPITFSSEVLTDYQEEFIKYIDKAFGLHSVLIPPPPPPPTLPKSFSQTVATISPVVQPRKNKSRSTSPQNSYSNYFTTTSSCGSDLSQSNNNRLQLTTLPLMGDLNGFFEEQYKKVELPLTQLSFELAYITKNLIDIQRDMTLHRMVIKKEDMESLIERCEALDRKVFDHVTLTDSLQQVLRDGWQEQLDKIRRQQNIFKQKLHEGQYLQDYARRALQTALTLRPFALYMASVIAISDTKRSDLIQRAPMEEICLQICNLEPDSRQRVEAIEKEEEARRQQQERAKIEDQRPVREAKQSLKVTKEPRTKKKSTSSSVVIEPSRDRDAMGSVVTRASIRRQKLEAQHHTTGDSSFNTSTCSNGSLSPRDFPNSPTSDISPIPSPVPSEDMRSSLQSAVVPQSLPSPTPALATEIPSTSSPVVPISIIPPPPPPPPEGYITPIQTSSEDQIYHHPSPILTLKKPKLSSIDSPSYETVRAREQLLEAIKERVKKIEADD
uniref:RING finger protein 207 n=1 Tax=Panagrolaimus superbus TaxID=310955 RepID=A0A914XYY5_9BILA